MMLIELHNLLQVAKAGMKKSHFNSSATAPIKFVQQSRGKKGNTPSQSKWKEKAHHRKSSGSKGKPNFNTHPVFDPKEVVLFHYG